MRKWVTGEMLGYVGLTEDQLEVKERQHNSIV